MNPGLKMMLATRGREGDGEHRRIDYGGKNDRFDMRYERTGCDGEMRRGEIGYERMNYGGDMRHDGGMEEMRRRRHKDGTFAPKSRYYPPEYDGDDITHAMGYDHPPMNNYPEQRRRGTMENRIGFRMGDDPHTEEPLTFPGQHMMHKGKGGQLDKETAESWVENMKNEDGTTGAHWTMEQTEQVRKQHGLDCDPVEFWAAMNAAYSDLSKFAKKYNTNTVSYYVDFVKSFWFNDQDAVPNKLAAYYEGVVNK